MKILTLSDPTSLYIELLEHLAEKPDERVVLQAGTEYIYCYDALAIHDILTAFSGKLDITVECLFGIDMITWCAFSSVDVERRHCMPSTVLDFSPISTLLFGDVTNMQITAKQISDTEDRLVALVTSETGMEESSVRLMMQERRALNAGQLIEGRFFGGHVNV